MVAIITASFESGGGGEGVGGLRADHQQEDKCFCRSRRDSGMIYLALKLIRPGAWRGATSPYFRPSDFPPLTNLLASVYRAALHRVGSGRTRDEELRNGPCPSCRNVNWRRRTRARKMVKGEKTMRWNFGNFTVPLIGHGLIVASTWQTMIFGRLIYINKYFFTCLIWFLSRFLYLIF